MSRAYLLGALVMMVGQRVTGASRPDKATVEKGSRWDWFADRNGISGHAYAGAAPMLVLATNKANKNTASKNKSQKRAVKPAGDSWHTG